MKRFLKSFGLALWDKVVEYKWYLIACAAGFLAGAILF